MNDDVLIKAGRLRGDDRVTSMVYWDAGAQSFRLLREWEGASLGEVTWMPDGRSFIYDSDSEEHPEDHLTAVTLERFWLEDGRSEPWLMPEISIMGNRSLAIHPDGHTVVFNGRVASGDPQFVIVPGVLDAP